MTAGPLRRIAFSFVGLLAGDAALLLVILAANLAGKFSLLHDFFGKPGVPLFLSSGIFFYYAIFSVAGWLLLGIVFALLVTTQRTERLSWLLILAGSLSGPLSLQLIFLWMDHGLIDLPTLRVTLPFSLFALLVSSTASAVYYALIDAQDKVRP